MRPPPPDKGTLKRRPLVLGGEFDGTHRGGFLLYPLVVVRGQQDCYFFRRHPTNPKPPNPGGPPYWFFFSQTPKGGLAPL